MLFRAIPLVKAINLKAHTLLRWLSGHKMCVYVVRRGAGGGGSGEEKPYSALIVQRKFPLLSVKSLHFQHFFPSLRVVTCLMAPVVLALLGLSNWMILKPRMMSKFQAIQNNIYLFSAIAIKSHFLSFIASFTSLKKGRRTA